MSDYGRPERAHKNPKMQLQGEGTLISSMTVDLHALKVPLPVRFTIENGQDQALPPMK